MECGVQAHWIKCEKEECDIPVFKHGRQNIDNYLFDFVNFGGRIQSSGKLKTR